MAVEFYKEFGDLGYLANYSDHGFTVDGVHYKTVEHFYQASKFDDPKIRERILECETPKEASVIGRDRSLPRIPNFREIKNQKMEEGIYHKFSQNKDIRSKLIETRNQEIREMSEKESYWGVGPNLDGENHVGQILMKVRERVKEELKREIVEKCKGKKIYVMGHSKPDPDSVFSSYLLAQILKSFGVDAVFAVRDTDFVEGDLIQDYLPEDAEVVTDYEDKNFVLVDHNSLKGIPKENVIGAIDHHRITGEVEDLIEMEYASTGLLLYDLFKEDYPFSSKEKELIGLTVLSDTEYLTSSRFGGEDKELYQSLGLELDANALKKKYFKTTIFNLDIRENLFKDYKEYDYDKFKIKRSMIKSYTKDREEHYDEYVESMKKNSINLLIWCDYEELATYICYQDVSLKFPYFTTSTMLVLDYLKKEKYLTK